MLDGSQRSPAEELALIEAMMERGRQAAAIDGRHMLIWGAVASLTLAVQYFAESRDWAPSAVLWLWQPLVLVGWIASLFFGRRAAMRRPRNTVSRTYVAAFAAAGLSIFLYLGASAMAGGPEPKVTVLLSAAAIGSAFFVMGVVTNIRWMAAVAGGWWLVLAYFAVKGPLVPTDLFVLSGATFLLLFLPGAQLAAQAGPGGRRARETAP